MDTTGEKEKQTSKKNKDGRSTSSHDNKKFRNRSLEIQRGMAFGFRKTATAVIKPDRKTQMPGRFGVRSQAGKSYSSLLQMS